MASKCGYDWLKNENFEVSLKVELELERILLSILSFGNVHKCETAAALLLAIHCEALIVVEIASKLLL